MPRIEHDLLDLPARRLLERRGNSRLRVPASAEPPLESPIPPGTSPKECDTIPYNPAVDVDPNTAATDSPVGAVDRSRRPAHHGRRHSQESSNTKQAPVTLPAGDGPQPVGRQRPGRLHATPSSARAANNPVACPPASKIGTVEDRDRRRCPKAPSKATSTSASSSAATRLGRRVPDLRRRRVGPLRDLDVRLIGNVSADPLTGQLTTTLRRNCRRSRSPPSSSSFNGGAAGGADAARRPAARTRPRRPDDPVVGQPAGDAGGRLHPRPPPRAAAPARKRWPSGPSRPASRRADEHPRPRRLQPVLGIDIARSDGQQELKGVDVDPAARA